jgi:hypothetical protein
MERPNTVAGLLAKRKELRQQIKKLVKHVRAIDGALLVFTETEHKRAGRGTYTERYRYVLSYLRSATGPITVSEVASAWICSKGLILDANQKNEMRRRIRVTFSKLYQRGELHLVGEVSGRKAWLLSK